jgi:membrane protease YdiL (CAAX protease family)
MPSVRDAPTLGAQAERLAGRQERSGSLTGTRSVALVVTWYFFAGAAAVGIALALGQNPLVCSGALGARGAASWLLSLGLGLPIGAATIALTRLLVRSAAWAHALHVALRPAVAGASDGAILAVATASAVGEELLFRGLLVPLIGILASSAIFGALHQIGGRARWGWMAWAAIMGAIFASVFAVTGSLLGPLVAHVAINHSNLRFLRDNDPAPRRRRLGGLLER